MSKPSEEGMSGFASPAVYAHKARKVLAEQIENLEKLLKIGARIGAQHLEQGTIWCDT